jgi:hypothetical protein
MKALTTKILLFSIITSAQTNNTIVFDFKMYYHTNEHGLKIQELEPLFKDTTISINYKDKELIFKQDKQILYYIIESKYKVDKLVTRLILLDKDNNKIECEYSILYKFVFMNKKVYL